MLTERRVVVTGLGAVTPIGNSVPDMWESVVMGTHGFERIEAGQDGWKHNGVVARVKDFDFLKRFKDVKQPDGEDLFTSKDLRGLGRFTQFGVAAAHEALQDAGLDPRTHEDPERISVFIATCFGGTEEMPDNTREYAKRGKLPPKNVLRADPARAAAVIQMKFGGTGPGIQVGSACASSGHAIELAMDRIRLGKSDIVVVGGAEAPLRPEVHALFTAAMTKETDPEVASRPFDVSADGFVMGEGAGVLILEEMDSALRRGAVPKAELVAAYSTSDRYGHDTSPAEEGQVRALNGALRQAGITPEEEPYINPHATSTPEGDPVEAESLSKGFKGFDKGLIYINPTKAFTGHLIGAAGAAEAVITVMVLENGIAPGNRYPKEPISNLDEFDMTQRPSHPRDFEYAGSNSFGFGAQNVTLFFRRFHA